MKKIDLYPLPYPADAQPALPAVPRFPVEARPGTMPRLIVLVPADADPPAAARQISKLASTTGEGVELLSLYQEAGEEPAIRRSAAAIAADLHKRGLCAELHVEQGTDWMEALQAHYQAGDIVVCFEEPLAGRWHQPLSQVLRSSFHGTVHILATGTPSAVASPIRQTAALLGFVAIMVGFTLLQITIVQLPEGWLENSLLIVSVLVEFWMIRTWNGWLGSSMDNN